MLFTQKYAPSSLSQLAGNEDAFSKMRRWAYAWQKNQQPQPLLVFGPCGVGKTCSAHALAQEHGFELLELNSANNRSSDAISRMLGSASVSGGLFGARKLLLMDDADFAASEDRGASSALAKIAGSCSQPLIITATDPYSKNLSQLRGLCEKIELKKVNVHAIFSLLKKICAAEKMPLGDPEVLLIAQNSQGDVRAALNDLQARNFAPDSREREKNVFEVVRGVLKGATYAQPRSLLMSASVPHDTLKLWIGENIPAEYVLPQDIAAAFGMLSRADVFDGRVANRQYWGFLRYSTALMGSGVALSKKEQSKKFTTYSYPSYIRVLGATKEKRATRKSLSRKFASSFHCSLSAGMLYAPLFSQFAKHDARSTSSTYSLEASEIAFLLGTTSEKAQKLMDNQAQGTESAQPPKPSKKKKPPAAAPGAQTEPEKPEPKKPAAAKKTKNGSDAPPSRQSTLA